MRTTKTKSSAGLTLDVADSQWSSFNPMIITPDPRVGTRSIELRASLDGHSVKALLDSGSMLNMVGSNFAREHKLRTVRLPTSNGEFQMRVADESLSPVTHGVVASLKINGVAVETFFFVSGGCDLLLGMPWLTQWRVSMDFATGSLTCRIKHTEAATARAAHASATYAKLALIVRQRVVSRKDHARKTRSSTATSLAGSIARLEALLDLQDHHH